MSRNLQRRKFLQNSAALGVGFWVAGGVRGDEKQSPNERVAIASIGISGKGASDSKDASEQGDLVAICDVDETQLGKAAEKFEKAKTFTDIRKLLDEMGKSIDAVTVSTPDHTHAPAALMAMHMGKHCFCQKPLTRTIYEARKMAEVARQMKVATQMGNQGTAGDELRRSAGWLRAGAIGAVKEVHVWTNRPIWPQGLDRPMSAEPPKTLDWDLWLSAARPRPYAAGYHPFKWRGWWDFGSGALGDIGCHAINTAFMGLDLRNLISVQAETSGHNRDSFPKWSIVTYEFGALGERPAMKLIWYDGDKLPPAELFEGHKPDAGWLAVGEKGKLMGRKFIKGEPVEVDYPKSPGHFEEWIRAIKGGEPAMSNFPDYAGPLSETVLAGNLAVWTAHEPGLGPKVEWDSKNMKSPNTPGLDELIKPTYRSGYTLDG